MTDFAVEEAVHLARTTLKAYKIGLNQNLPSHELYILAKAYGKAFGQLESLTGWHITKMNLVVVGGVDWK
jgi:hypothetical protein